MPLIADVDPVDVQGFAPAPQLRDWAYATFIDDGAVLENPDHAHLRDADIGFLWAMIDNARRGRMVIGQAEPGTPQGAMGKWAKGRAEQQVTEWFGGVPDFIITVHSPWWQQATDAEACALIEHELYHCAQEHDEFGQPKFSRQTGRPVYGMRGHDVEEFIGVARRYGATGAGVRDLVEAVNAGPEIDLAEIAHACGTCSR